MLGPIEITTLIENEGTKAEVVGQIASAEWVLSVLHSEYDGELTCRIGEMIRV